MYINVGVQKEARVIVVHFAAVTTSSVELASFLLSWGTVWISVINIKWQHSCVIGFYIYIYGETERTIEKEVMRVGEGSVR